LIYINLMLALFNMIPAFPMDGGRVLRALLSGWLGRGRATMIAASIGRGLALVFGGYSLTRGGLHQGFLQVFLAGFIYLAAGQELSRVLAEEEVMDARRRGERGRIPTEQGIWTAPPGFRWEEQGNGVWRLAPITVAPSHRRAAAPWS